MKALLLSFLLLSALIAFGQTAPGIKWSKTYGGSKEDATHAIAPTSDHGYIVAGYTNSNEGDVGGLHAGSVDYWVMKIDSLGMLQWQKCLGGNGWDEANAIQQTTDGGFIVVGWSNSSDGDVTGHHGFYLNKDCWVVKLSATGDIEWQKSLGGGNGDDGGNAVRVTSDGGYIIAGYTNSSDGDVSGRGIEGFYDFWVVKLDAAGTIQWQEWLGKDGYFEDVANDIQLTPDGGYIVVGKSANKEDPDPEGGVNNHYDYLVIKLDSTGGVLWQKKYGGGYDDMATSVQVATDGGYIIAGSTAYYGEGFPGSENFNYWVVKLTPDGNIQWQKSLGGKDIDMAESMLPTPDGGYLVAGYSYSTDGDVTGNHGSNDYWIVKLSSTGDKLWQKSLGGSKSDFGLAACLAADGSYSLAGYSYSTDGDVPGNKGNYDVWVVKLSAEGVLPITLTNFTAQKQHNDVLLQWQTATEVNSKQFNVQRSNDGDRFTTIGTTPAAGNSTAAKSYTYTDVGATIQPGVLYYRLEQVDKDGSKYYSKVDVIKNLPANVFTVMPNPVKSSIIIQSKINAARGTVQLSDMNGKIIYSSNKAISAGYLQIPAANLAAGNYMLTIQANGDKYVVKVVKE